MTEDIIVRSTKCRYRIALRRLEVVNAVEQEVRITRTHPLKSLLPLLAVDPETWQSRDPAVATRGEIIVDERKVGPTHSGYTQISVPFDSPVHRIDFSLGISFGPKGAALLLERMVGDLKMELVKDELAGPYEIDIKDPSSRIGLSISREVYRGGAWVNSLTGRAGIQTP